ncbi:MAG: hypothetical protein MK135_03345 [Polyangiaceae bacterium]|nr:hypothetical protein [Polyangiaceae bacterium]
MSILSQIRLAILLCVGVLGVGSMDSALAAVSDTHGTSNAERVAAAEIYLTPDDAQAEGGSLPPVPEEFLSRDLGWARFAAHPAIISQVEQLVEAAPQMRDRLRTILGPGVLEHVEIRVGRTPSEMKQLAPEGSRPPHYASGLAYSDLHLVLLTEEPLYPGERFDLRETLFHELAHIALHDAIGRENIPRWFNEGFAIYASEEAAFARVRSLWIGTVSGNLLPLSQLSRSFPSDSAEVSLAYAQSADMLRFLQRAGEEHRFSSLLSRLADGQEFHSAIADAYATDLFSLEKEWHQQLQQRYSIWPILFGGSLVWVFGFVLIVLAYTKRRTRAEKKLARWAQEEAQEDYRLALRKAWEAHLRQQELKEGEPSSSIPPLSPRVWPVVHHRGQRHTLH